MKILRPALLVLLMSSLAGLGVPGSFGQASKSSKSSAKPKTSSSATSTRGKSSSKNSKNKNSSRSRRQPGQKAPTTDRITEIQTALAKNGSFEGTPNGKWDDDSAAAMKKFQSSHGLNPSGKIDALTLQRLGLGSQTAGVAAPTPPPGATSRLTSANSLRAAEPDSSPQR